MAKVDLLCIDEVGKESSATPQVIGEFEEWLKTRQDNCRSTILVSNLAPIAFQERYEESVWNALTEKFKVLTFDPDNDFREKVRDWGYLSSTKTK